MDVFQARDVIYLTRDVIQPIYPCKLKRLLSLCYVSLILESTLKFLQSLPISLRNVFDPSLRNNPVIKFHDLTRREH